MRLKFINSIASSIAPLPLLCILFALFSSCATIYLSPDFDQNRSKHKTVAILPLEVKYDSNSIPVDIDIADLTKMKEEEGYMIQLMFYERFNLKTEKISNSFQNVLETNKILAEKGITYSEVRETPITELAELLGVDVVIRANVEMSKPMGEIEAVAMYVMFGVGGYTNRIDFDIEVYEGSTGTLMWNYKKSVPGGVTMTIKRLLKATIRKIVRTYPYKS